MSEAVARWREVGNYLADAQTAERIMTNERLPVAVRSAAASRHASAVAALLETLIDLRRDGVFDDIADCLRGRSAG